jgi:hypothetical protein
MKKEFVPHELALTLKEKGFDEPCLRGYNSAYTENNKPVLHDFVYGELQTNTMYEKCRLADVNVCTAPLWQQVIDWLSDVHNIEVDALRYTYRGGVYQGKCYMWFVDQYDPKYNHELEEDDSHWILNERKAQGYDFKTKREAILAGITEALTLI